MLMRCFVCLYLFFCLHGQAVAQGALAAVQGTPSALPAQAQARAGAAQAGAYSPASGGDNSARAIVSAEQAVAEALQGILQGYRFNKRLLAQDPQDQWLLFSRGADDVALVGWTSRTGTDEQRLALAPASPMPFVLYNWRGEPVRSVDTIGYEIGMVLENEPKILLPTDANAYLILAASAQAMPPVMRVKGPQAVELVCEFYNPLNEIAIMPVPDMGKTFAMKPGGNITVRKEVPVGRASAPIHTSIGAMGIRQPVTIMVENPLELTVRPEEPQVLTLDIINTGGEEINGEVLLELSDTGEPFRLPLQFQRGQQVNTVRIPLNAQVPLPSPLRVAVEQTVGQPMRRTYRLAQTGLLQFMPAANFLETNAQGAPAAYRVVHTQGVSAAIRGGVPGRTAVPWPGFGALGLVYDLGAAEQAQVDVEPVANWAAQVMGTPSQIGFWLQGDGSGNRVSLVWTDAAGNEHASEEQAVTWRGWNYVLLAVPSGAQVEYPLGWTSLLRVRDARGEGSGSRHGVLLANGFCFIYGQNQSLPSYRDPAASPYVEQVSRPAAPATYSEPEILRGKPMQISPKSGGRR